MNVFVKRLRLLREVALNLPVRGTAKPGKSRNPIAWRQAMWYGRAIDLGADERRGVPHGCNTTACLAGFAGLTPALMAEGMRTNRKTGTVQCKGSDGQPIYMGSFFGLNSAENDALFGACLPDNSAQARDVMVGKIETLIAQAIDRS